MAAEDATKPAPLAPYPEMILAAIDGLDDKNGSNKSAISSYIEGKYGDLPPAHASLLTAHLASMKETGELVFSKNNYFRADAPCVPPKRGRGRPPKPKEPSATAAAAARDPASSSRPRGRPPKPKDPVLEAIAKAKKARARGRPPKRKDPVLEAIAKAKKARARGRPPKKAKVAQESPIGAPTPAPSAASTVGDVAVKRGRGRPPKVRPAAA